jgi:hypothetical protein
MAGPKKHHYVPQSILRRFSINNEGRQIHVFDKASARSYVAAITDAGAENHFYSIEVGDQRLVLEDLFNDIDYEGAELLDKICQARSLSTLSEEERLLLCIVAAAQLLRVKRMRNDLIEVTRQLLATLEKFGVGNARELDGHVMSENQARIASIETFAELPFFAGPFLEKDLFLISSQSESFFIGDNPVVVNNSFPYGELGLSSPGVEIYFPISRDLVVGFYCASIRRGYLENFETWGEARYQPLLNSMRSGEPVEFSPEQVGFLNQLQVQRSTQHLYLAEPDFSLVRDMLARAPDIAQGKASIQIGWDGYGHRESMPVGTFIVAVGQVGHSMIPAEIVDDNPDDCELTFRTPLPEMVEAAIRDSPFKEVSLFIDKHIRRQIRDVIFLMKEDGTICVRMRDEAVHQLFRTIDAERRTQGSGRIEEPGETAQETVTPSGEPVKRFSRESLEESVAVGRQLAAEGRLSETQLEELLEIEDRLNGATQEEWDNYNHFVENLPPDDSDLALLVSSGNDLVQEKVQAFIGARLPNPAALALVEFTASQYLAVGEALCGDAPEPARLWRRIRELHDLAHSTLGLGDEAVADLVEGFLSELGEVANVEEPRQQVERAIFMIYHEICWLVSMASEKE